MLCKYTLRIPWNGAQVYMHFRILILASAVFFYGSGAGSGGPASLFDAYDLLRDLVGQRESKLR